MPSREELQALSADWVAEGIISAEQRQRILARSRGDQEGVSRVVVILSVFGAAVVVLGLTLIVATNWENISFLAKLGAGVALMVAVDAAGYWLRFGRPALRKTGEALLLIGSGLLMADLALVSQQYHILTNPAPILLLTWLAVATMPYFAHSRVYALVSAGLFVELLRDGSPLQIEDDAIPVFLCLAGAGAGVLAVGSAHRLTRYRPLAVPTEVVEGALLFVAVYTLGFYRWLGTPALLIVGAAVMVFAGRSGERT